jgi:hypothetical protein
MKARKSRKSRKAIKSSAPSNLNYKFIKILLNSRHAKYITFFTNITDRNQAIAKLLRSVPKTLKLRIVNNNDKNDRDTDIYEALEIYGAM